MAIVFGAAVDITSGVGDSPDGTFGVFRLSDDMVLSTWPSADQRGASFSIVTLDGVRVVAAQPLDPSRYVPGGRDVESQEIFGALLSADGTRVSVFFSEQGYDDGIRDFTTQCFVRSFDLATGAPIGPAREIDSPAYLGPSNSQSMQTSDGLLAVSAGYSGLGPLSDPRDLGLILYDAQGNVVAGPTSPRPDSFSSPNAGGHAIVEAGGLILAIHATLDVTFSGFFPTSSSDITGQFYRPDGTPVGGPFAIFEDIVHPLNTNSQNAVRAAVLTDGRVIVVTPDRNAPAPAGGGTSAQLTAVILNPDGSVSVPAFGIRQSPDQQFGSPRPLFSLNALDDGGFVIGHDIQASGIGENYGFQMYDADARPTQHAVYIVTLADTLAGAALSQGNTVLRGDGTGLIISESAQQARSLTVPVEGGPPATGPTPGPDTLRGDDGPDVIDGLAGDDRIDGRGGDDVLRGGDGNDSIAGGAGNDRLHGDRGNDTVAGGAGHDTVVGEAGNDILRGDAGNDRIEAGSGRDVLRGGGGNDSLSGANDADRLFGGAGRDTLDGGNGDDLLSGEGGADRLSGGAGNDRLTGGAGNDRLDGGTGGDVFVFAGAFGADVIEGFDRLAAGEVIDLGAVRAITGFADLVDNHMAQVGRDTVITAGANTITLAGVRAERLTMDDFLF